MRKRVPYRFMANLRLFLEAPSIGSGRHAACRPRARLRATPDGIIAAHEFPALRPRCRGLLARGRTEALVRQETRPSTPSSSRASRPRTMPPPPARSTHWAADAEGALALLVLLDQFPRNAWRGSGHMFATDGKALRRGARGDRGRPGPAGRAALRPFFYLPFMHSESLADQERSVALNAALDANTQRFARAAPGHHRALRPLSASQRGAGPRHHGRGTDVSRRRRLRGLDLRVGGDRSRAAPGRSRHGRSDR